MMKFLLIFFLLATSAYSNGWRGAWGGGAAQTSSVASIHEAQFDYVVNGQVTLESGNVDWAMDATPSAAMYSVIPLSTLYGHTAVRLNWIHLNPGPDNVTTGVGVGDSAAWHFRIMLIAFHGGTPDTLTEDVHGAGGYITHAQFSGFMTPPVNRMYNLWAASTSVDRTYQDKSCPTITYCKAEADSIQIWTAQWDRSDDTVQALYYNIGYTSLPSLKDVPQRNLHITGLDSAYAFYDFVKLGGEYDRESILYFWSFDIGPRYTIASNPPYDNQASADAALDSKQLENNFHLFIGERPMIETTLAVAVDSGASTIYVNMPADWDSSTYTTFASYQPPQRPTIMSGNGTWGVFIQHDVMEPGRRCWMHTGTLTSASALDTASGIWRLTLSNTGETPTADTSFAVGARVWIVDPVFFHWLGIEDILFDGYYGTTQTPLIFSPLAGLNVNFTSGVDSVSGTARAHYNFYRGWDESCPMYFPDGFELYSQKTYRHANVDGFTWRFLSTVVWYSLGAPYNCDSCGPSYAIQAFSDSLALTGALDTTMQSPASQAQYLTGICNSVTSASYSSASLCSLARATMTVFDLENPPRDTVGCEFLRKYMGFDATDVLGAGETLVSLDSVRFYIVTDSFRRTDWTDTLAIAIWDSMQNRRLPGTVGGQASNAAGFNSLDEDSVLGYIPLASIANRKDSLHSFTLTAEWLEQFIGDTIPLGLAWLRSDLHCTDPGNVNNSYVRIVHKSPDGGILQGSTRVPWLKLYGKKRVTIP